MADVGQGYVHPELLAEAEWLAEHLYDTNVRVIDCDTFDSYRRAHIPNAVGLRVHHYIKGDDDSPHVMPPGQLADLMGGLGVGSNTEVIAYDGSGGLHAARMWWVLNYYGHRRVRVLNGGWNKWLHEGHPISMAELPVAPATFTPRAVPDFLCTLDHLKGCIGSRDVVLLDVRSDAEWTGENLRNNRRGGRLPGAVHLEWLNFVTDDALRTFKSADELRAMLAAAGVTPDREVITY